MTFSRLRHIAFFLVLLFAHGIAPAWSTPPSHWISSWTAVPDSPGPALQAQTIRQIVRTSVGGTQLRVRLSNLFGDAPLAIGAAHLALRDSGAAIRPGSGGALTFGKAKSVLIPPGESILSDPLTIEVAPLQELALSMFLPAGTGRSTIHGAGMQTAYLVPGDDLSQAKVLPSATTDDSRYFVTDVEVAANREDGTLVVVGDSIADGIGSTEDRNARWPDVLAQQLQRGGESPRIGVANAGIAGNRILRDAAKPFVGPSTLARFERDALAKPGVRWIILAQGINDIVASDMLADKQQHASVEELINAMRSLVRRARERGVRVWAATLMPYGGVRKPFVHSAEGEAKRQAVNAWIRDSGEFDAVLDFDLLMRDRERPDRLLHAFDSGDHLHPNDAGYVAMAATAHALIEQEVLRAGH